MYYIKIKFGAIKEIFPSFLSLQSLDCLLHIVIVYIKRTNYMQNQTIHCLCYGNKTHILSLCVMAIIVACTKH